MPSNFETIIDRALLDTRTSTAIEETRTLIRSNLGISGSATLADGDYGDIVVSGTGTVLSIDSGVIVNADINASAAIDASKIANGSVSNAEFQRLDGVTSGIQTQIDGKQPLDSNLTTIAGLTATTDNFIVSVSSAWASRTPTQVRTTLGLVIGTNVQAYDANYLKSNTAANLTVGYTATGYNAGTKSSGTFTPDPANGALQYAVNGGAHTLAPPSTGTGTAVNLAVQYTNNGSAGAITTSGFTKVSGSFTTTNGDDFMCYMTVINGFSHLNIVALQ